MDMKRFFLYAIAIAALALAGCGGNGGMAGVDPAPTDPAPTDPAPTDPAPTTPEPPPMELVHGIVTANSKAHSATNPAPYNHMDRPDGDTVTVGVKDDGTFGDVLIGTNKLTMSEDMTPPSVGRFAEGSVSSRTSMGVTDTVYAYETKTAPGPRAYNMQYVVTNTPSMGIQSVDLNEPASTTVQKFNVINFDTSGDDDNVSEIAMRFGSAMFPSTESQTFTYHTADAYDDIAGKDRGPTDVRGQKFDGMFHGIPGEYSCDAGQGSCTATTNNKGRVDTLVGTWSFTPDNVELGVTGHMVQGVVNDTDYLTFGYWVQKDEDTDGSLTIGVTTFVNGTALEANYAAALANLVGTADYEGKAVGKFVKKTLTTDGMATISDGGVFTADADLTAHFSGNTISFNDRYTVRGTIDDFRNADGDMIDPNWSVTLMPATFATDTDPSVERTTTGAEFANGVTAAGGPAGDWGGSFYGDTPDDLPVANNGGDNDAYPSSVGGEFDAHFTNGHALGAFGATR